ncbi:Polynucleotide 5'-hydroxyl-kinase grc3 [Pestalotiopsis sp. 9143b]|nr:Polynucleotide 5'-hydroxyl-kinase grc3 [Pestalotiopsis sp. 9143b]
MASKRRKLDTAEQPPAQSAFARLRNLRSQAKAPEPAAEAQISSNERQTETVKTEVTQASSATPKRPKRGQAAQVSVEKTVVSTPVSKAQPESNAGLATPYAIPADPEIVESVPVIQQQPVTQLSSFSPTKSNFKKKAGGKLHLKLADGERLVVLGSYGITVNSGHITICGAVLRATAKTHWVHASHCQALPVIRCPDGANIELESCPGAQSLRQLGRVSPLFRGIWDEPTTKDGNSPASSTFTILYTSVDGPKRALLSDLKSPPEWNREIDALVKTARRKVLSAVITGPKSAGKSTFGRLLANSLLTDDSSGKKQHSGVAILDLDPGQPEHGPPGQISLVRITEPVLSPSFCRTLSESTSGWSRSIIRSHTLAAVSPASDPDLYLSSVADLVTHYRNRLASLPLVVNTPGWVQGTGLDLLISLIETAKPTHVMYMAPGPFDVIDALQASFKSGKITKLPSQTSQYTSRTAAHLRTMQTLSYFHANVKAGAQTWFSEPLSAVPPWCVRYSGPSPGVLGIMCYDFQTPTDILADAINGTILAIVEVESSLAFRSNKSKDFDEMDSEQTALRSTTKGADPLTTTTPEGIPIMQAGVTLDPRYSQTIGLALLRGIDTDNKVLQLLSPVPDERIDQIIEKDGKIVLVSGRFDPPGWAYTEDLYYQSSTANSVDADEQIDIIGEDEAIDSDHEPSSTDLESASMPTPWIEFLRGSQKRGNGSRVWRVRRDLGRANSAK